MKIRHLPLSWPVAVNSAGATMQPVWLGLLSLLCGCCRPASGHTVRSVSETAPAINEGFHQIQNLTSIKEMYVFVIEF